MSLSKNVFRGFTKSRFYLGRPPFGMVTVMFHGMEILARFPGNPTLEIIIKIHNWVGSTNMRERFLIKVCLFPIYNCPVILGYFLGLVYLILVNLRNFNPHKNSIFRQFFVENHFLPSEFCLTMDY